MDMLGFIAMCGELELDGVELLANHFASTDRDYLRELKRACAERHLTIAMVSANGHLTTPDDAQRVADVEELRKWFDVAAWLGAPCLRFFCGKGEEMEAGGSELYGKVLTAVRQIVSMGEERGIVAAMENHGGTTADQLLQLHADISNPWFAFTLDTGNFPPTSQVGPETYLSIERVAPHAAIVHAKFFNVTEDGSDAEFDWPRIHSILKKAGFRGFLSVEYEGKDKDEIAVMRRIARYLNGLR